MSLLARLFAPRPDARQALRSLWHRVVEISRERAFYAEDGVADTVAGRFDMIATVLALVLLRLEREDGRAPETALLAELFVEDMDGQLRESGVGDLVVGKHIGRLMAVLGGRIGALRDALASDDPAALEAALARNVTMRDGRSTGDLAKRVRGLHASFAVLDTEDLLAGGTG